MEHDFEFPRVWAIGIKLTESLLKSDSRNGNGSQFKDADISGAIFKLSLSILILNSQCVEGARDVRVL